MHSEVTTNYPQRPSYGARTTTLHTVTYRATVAGCSLIGEFAPAAQLAVRPHRSNGCSGDLSQRGELHWTLLVLGVHQQQSPTSLSHPDREPVFYSFLVSFQPGIEAGFGNLKEQERMDGPAVFFHAKGFTITEYFSF